MCIRDRYIHNVQRPWVVATTLATLNRVWVGHPRDPPTAAVVIPIPKPLVKVTEIRHKMEELEDYLTHTTGHDNFPLSYLIRDDATPPAVNDDLGLGLPSFQAELIRRGRHDGRAFLPNQSQLWQVLRVLFSSSDVWPYIKRFELTQNGRGAVLIIKTHYLGVSFSARVRSGAETILAKAHYDGKSRNFSLERFFSMLQTAFNDLPPAELTNGRKMDLLMTRIQDPILVPAKAQIMATPNLHDDYDSAVNYLVEFNDRQKALSTQTSQGRKLASVDSGRGGAGRGSGRGRGNKGRGRGGGRGDAKGKSREIFNPSDPGRYYKPSDWAKLTDDQRAKARAAGNPERAAARARRATISAAATVAAPAAPAPAPAPAVQFAPADQVMYYQPQLAAVQQQLPPVVRAPAPPAGPPPRGIGSVMSRRVQPWNS